jgi:hypothetical protein
MEEQLLAMQDEFEATAAMVTAARGRGKKGKAAQAQLDAAGGGAKYAAPEGLKKRSYKGGKMVSDSAYEKKFMDEQLGT